LEVAAKRPAELRTRSRTVTAAAQKRGVVVGEEVNPRKAHVLLETQTAHCPATTTNQQSQACGVCLIAA